MKMNTEKYFENLVAGVKKEYGIAAEARKKGLDPINEVEIPLAMSLAEKAVGLISTIYPQLEDSGIIKRILELEEQYGQLDTAVSFKIAEEIAKEKFCKFRSLLEAIDAGIRIGFAYNTLGVVASPIEGYTQLKLGKTKNGKEYFIAYFSGPIRSAGTTATCVALMLIDYLRELFGFEKYDATEEEVRRYVTENYDYHERVNNLQYLPTEEEIVFLARNIPIQISGEPTEQREVSNYKDLPRVETNFIRGGMCLCFSEGLAQKAGKGLRMLKSVKEKGFHSTGWDFLEKYVELHEKVLAGKGKGGGSATYIKDLVAGRPVFGHPGRSGAFRFRYGRSRVAGFSAVSIHPATMAVSNCFLSTGTQLKIEKPTKGCVVTSCDEIDGPIVKLRDGCVKKLDDFEEAKKIYPEVEEIIYFGDILFPLGDVINRNAELLKAGYVEEWWKMDAEKAGADIPFNVNFKDAVRLSSKFGIPMHPKYIFYWSQISKDDFFWLLDWMQNCTWRDKLLLPYSKSVREKFSQGKRALELLGAEHDVVFDNVIIKNGEALLSNLGIDTNCIDFREEIKHIILESKELFEIKNDEEKKTDGDIILELVNKFSKFKIKDKAGDFIGTRMGRPEKAKMRKLTGSPNVLFPIGDEGGRFRSINEAVEKGHIKADWPAYFCNECGMETIYRICENCGKETRRKYYCRECKKILNEKCEKHESKGFYTKEIDSKYFFEKAIHLLNMENWEVPALIKGVRGTSSEEHDFEHPAKGILRARHNLCVNKDGTIRYDGTELPITHFKPKEIKTSIKKLIELGYERDIYGNNLENDEQILELMPHDIILPSCPDTKDEKADDVFFNITRFVDEELKRFYYMEKYYNFNSKEDLIGVLVVCMAPHNCAGVIGRVIGFSKCQGLYASPYMHAAMRRDCDGDEAAVMLLLDVLLNFSKKFLPSHRGGNQDAPLVLNAHIRAGEVDEQILDFEICSRYPLEMYEAAEQRKHSGEIKIETVKTRLKNGKDTFANIGFTHDSSDFNKGVINSSYKFLPTMKDKVEQQMDLVKKIRAVDTGDVAHLIIDRHFIRDLRGNLRKFSHQIFRCVACNEKFRRPPMAGKCTKCGGRIIFTISEGSIKKYLEPALKLAEEFNIPSYTKQGLELTKIYIESIFGKDEDKQIELKKWF